MRQESETYFNRGKAFLFGNVRLLLIFAPLGGAVGVALSYSITPIYRADATLIFSDQMMGLNQSAVLGGLTGLASLVGVPGSGSKESEAMEILKSRALTRAFIQENGLLPIIFHDRWNPLLLKWKKDRPGYAPTLEDANSVFDKSIRSVIENRKTSLITISISWTDPRLARQWTDGLVDAANDLLRRQAIERSAKNLEYLKKASEGTSVMEVKGTIYKLMETEIKTQMMASGSKDYAFRVVDPAVIPERRVFPKRSLFLVFGVIVGCISWFLVSALRQQNRAT